MRPRHSDTDLIGLARDGSAPAFAALLHRHRDVIHRGALRSQRPERAAELALVAAVRDLRRGRADEGDIRGWLEGLVEGQVRRFPGAPGIERLLPGDWFDSAWVEAERSWPSGRRRLRFPRWLRLVTAAMVLALAGAVGTYLVITAEVTTEVVSELIAEPIEDPDALVVPGPIIEQVPEEAPELFGDVELGDLPTYDLTGAQDRDQRSPPTIGPRERDDGSSAGGDDEHDDGGESGD